MTFMEKELLVLIILAVTGILVKLLQLVKEGKIFK